MEKFNNAIDEWRNVLRTHQIVANQSVSDAGPIDTGPLRRRVIATLYPESESEIEALVRIAHQHTVPLYPVSTGKNWGYGGSNPPREGCALVNLSGMQRILEFDEHLGYVTVEPGVTQAQLHEFLRVNGKDFLVPTSGAGPTVSILGNALERGYGLTPEADHFAACTRLRAVLADGSIYDTPLSMHGGHAVDRCFKWGVGPFLDGIFTQSNFGIVTSMTIALARRPESVVGFFFGVPNDADLGKAVATVQRILQRTKGVSGSINLMNRRRVLAMLEPYPNAGSDRVIQAEELEKLAKSNQIMCWTGAGALYGDKRLVAAAKAIIRKELRGTAKRLVFLTPRRAELLFALSKRLPGTLGDRARKMFGPLRKTMQLLNGAPNEIALPLCYWRSGTPPADGQACDPARDGCGLYWYSPLVPMVPDKVKEYVAMVERICVQRGIEPLITLTSLSDRCWDSTVPILFDPQRASDVERAKQCYRELFQGGRESGFVPYRAHVDTMELLVDEKSDFWKTAAKIKAALDPKGIMSPGRYSEH